MPDGLIRTYRALLDTQQRLVKNTTQAQRRWMGLALAGMLIMSAGLMWLSSRVEWRTLYTNMDAREAQQAASELATAKIPYQLDVDGTTLRVPVNLVDKARLSLAVKGLPQSGRLGFELFDKPNWVGSEFDEKVNYQRALEGELEHTISSMGAIQSARVHLVLPHDSLFESQQRPAKASVVIKLARRNLSDSEGDSIRTLVASAVEGLDPGNVTLVDADGRASFGQRDAQTQAAVYEQELVDRLSATLDPVAGRDNIRSSVNVDYDSSNTDETQEIYDPKATVLVSDERSDQSQGGQPRAAGIPGTASNAPNGGGATNGTTPPAGLPLFPSTTSANEISHQENTNYFASKRTLHVVQGPGQLKRLTVAILLNNKLVTTGSGKDVKRQFLPRSPEELQQIEQLAKAAVGFNAARGDQIAVENIAFADNVVPTPPSFADRFLPRRDHAISALWLLGPIVMFLLLFFFVFRPAGRHIAQQVAISELSAGAGAATLPEPALAPALHEARPDVLMDRPLARPQLLREAVAERMTREPAPVVRLVKSWIAETSEGQ
jgi:flagellar M-ring protein FliF